MTRYCLVCERNGERPRLRQRRHAFHEYRRDADRETFSVRPQQASSRKEPIWELAEMLSGEVLEFSDDLRSVFDTLEELEKLRPSEGDEDGEGDNDKDEGDDDEDWEKEDEDN